MLNDRYTPKNHLEIQERHQTPQLHFYSVKPTRPQQEGGMPKGKLIRNQFALIKNSHHQQQHRTLTPQYSKQQDRKKHVDAADVQSFKLEESKVNTKYLTVKKDPKEKGSEETKKGANTKDLERIVMKEMGNGTINLNQGWIYKGQYSSGLFHGYGQLIYHQRTIYKGRFEFGYFHGHGLLNYNEIFRFLIPLHCVQSAIVKYLYKHGQNQQADFNEQWTSYLGEFRQGQVNGYGELRMQNCRVVGCWQKGKISKRLLLLPLEHTQ